MRICTDAMPMKPSEENRSAAKPVKSMIYAALNNVIFGGTTVSAATMRAAPAIRTKIIGQFYDEASILE